MKKYGKWKMVAVGAVIIVAAMFLFGSCKPKIKVETAGASYGKIIPTVSVYGEVRGVIAELSPKVPAIIKTVRVKEGDRVVKGQVLAEFDGFETAGNEYKALRQLSDSGLASEQQLEQAVIALESSMLISPFDGVVTLIANRAGETVSPGMTVISVVQPGTSYAELQIDESEIGEVKTGMDVLLFCDAYPNDEFSGKLERISLSAELRKVAGRIKMDEEDRVFRGRVALDKGREKLKIGMSVNADIITQVKENVLTVPRGAVFSKNGESFVYVVRNNRAKQTAVELGLKDMDNVEIITGLKDGDAVVVSIPGNLKNNSGVKVEK
jgi:RND family efflux transporter MFP subunit